MVLLHYFYNIRCTFSVLFILGIAKSSFAFKEPKNEIPDSEKDVKYSYLPRAYAHMSSPELIEVNGFPLETHEVRTPDGYILMKHRIPNEGGMPVIIMHGILCSSRDWLMQKETDALPFQLHLQGYDVWLGNMRGNNYSQGHEFLPRSTSAYWDFSVDHVSLMDVPAVIDYVLGVTGRSELAYVGYSLGTTTLFSGLVARPEYQDKVKCFAAMAPVTVKGNCKSDLVRILAALALPEQPLKGALDLISHGEFVPSMLRGVMHQLLPEVCSESNGLLNAACEFLPQLVGGFSPNQVDESMQSIIFAGFPSPISVRMLIQQLQSVGSGAGRFRQYHFQDTRNNINTYGALRPPDIDISQFTVPTMLFCGLNDFLAPPEDVAFVRARLPNIIYMQNISDPLWNHLDFLYAKQARELVYDDLVAQLKLCAPPDA